MSGTSFDADVLIDLVRDRDCLYNIKSNDYRNRPLKEKAWMEIGRAMAMNPQDCEKKWKNIRDSYIRNIALEKKESRSGAGAKRKRWYLMESLSFLAAYDPQDGSERETNVGLPLKVGWMPELTEADFAAERRISILEDSGSEIDDPSEDRREPRGRSSSRGSSMEAPSRRKLTSQAHSSRVGLQQADKEMAVHEAPTPTYDRGIGRPIASQGTARTHPSSSRGSLGGGIHAGKRRNPGKTQAQMGNAEAALIDAINRTEPTQKSDCEHFLLSLVKKMEALPPRKQLEFQIMCLQHFASVMDE